jgi:hypothetical protein
VDIPLVLAVALWLIAHWLDSSRSISLTPWFITGPLIALVLLTGLSGLWATSEEISVELFLRLCWLLALYLLIRNEVATGSAAAKALAGGLVLQSLMAIVQFHNQGPVGLFLLGETSGPSMDWIRGYGFSPHPNILGGYLAIGLAATLALALGARRRHQRNLWILVFGIGVGGLVATFSRSAWLGILLGMGLTTVVVLGVPDTRARWGKTLLLLGVVAAGVLLAYAVAAPHVFVSRLVVPAASTLGMEPLVQAVSRHLPWYTHVEQTILAEREGYGRIGLQLIADHLPLGVGAANFSLAFYLEQPGMLVGHLYQPVHNVLLLLSAELGPVGGMAWSVLLVALALALWRTRRVLAHDPWLLGWSVATLALMAISFFDYYAWGWEQGRIMFWCTMGLWAGSYSRVVGRQILPVTARRSSTPRSTKEPA